MASPVVNNNGAVAITVNGNYCPIQVPGFISGVPATVVQPQFWECSYFIQSGSTGAGTVVTFQVEANDGTWSNISNPAPITIANSTTYNSTIQAPCGGLRINVSSATGNGIAYVQLAGIEVPTVSGSGQVTTASPKTPPVVVQTVQSGFPNATVATASIAYSANVTAGNTLIALVDWNDQTSTISSVKDSLNTPNWTLAGIVERGNNISAAIYYYYNTLGGACTATLTMTAAVAFPEIAVIEVSGLSGVVDATSANFGSSNLPDPGALVTSAANDFILSAGITTSVVNTGAGGSWVFSILHTSSNGFQYLNAGPAGSYDGNFTGGTTWLCTQAAFKAGNPPALPAITLAVVQKKIQTNDTASTTQTISFSSNTTTGNNLILQIVNRGNGSSPISSIAISAGSATFSRAATAYNSTDQDSVEIWFASNITGGTTPTLTITLNVSIAVEIAIYEVSGANLIVDVGAQQTNPTQSTAMSSGNLSTATAVEIIFGVFTTFHTITAGEAGWVTDFSFHVNLFEYLITTSSGNYAATATQNAIGSYTVAAVAFRSH